MNEQEILAEIRAAFDAIDPPPPHVLQGAQAAFRWRDPGALLVELAGDAAVGPPGLRQGGGPRLLSFTGHDVGVEIEVVEEPEGRRLVGRLLPPATAAVVLRHAHGQLRSGTDMAGQFVVDGVPGGPVSLLFRLPDGVCIVTSWVLL
ncbi:hypothetical protein Acsp04_44650 [Actinomadura sp. NBRC 104425]|uniref:hypothetical protein n=1 Tax=Actinomadura sp. NBRC 104425 TaxID=3032204 RepID=UPI0024A4FCEB|nr:hypothetical protein [Actinomadura sp. NBRC 104425]GLZ14230.1 hypothetical protein Acsp04_44650 [Actinomadura sp. NBRC 104425]